MTRNQCEESEIQLSLFFLLKSEANYVGAVLKKEAA